MSLEFIRDKYKDEVILPDGVVVISAEASTAEGLDRELGDRLSEYTLEQGMELPKGTQVNRSRLRKVGPLVVKRISLSSETLIP